MIHATALVDDPKSIGSETNIWAYAHVMAGARIGQRCNVGDHVFIENGAVVGDNVTIKNQVLIWEGITIEDDVFVGPAVVFTNDRFPRSPRMAEVASRYGTKESWLVPTLVQRGCSIGAAATICPGVTLGSYAMIAAGSVVTTDVEPHALVVGSPARCVGYVCRCGLKLDGHSIDATCRECGETVNDRQNDYRTPPHVSVPVQTRNGRPVNAGRPIN